MADLGTRYIPTTSDLVQAVECEAFRARCSPLRDGLKLS